MRPSRRVSRQFRSCSLALAKAGWQQRGRRVVSDQNGVRDNLIVTVA